MENDCLKDGERYENNVKMDVTEISCEDQRWLELAQDHIQR
jgi:hypothetical protein